MTFVPCNLGEKEMLKSFLISDALVLMLYKNLVTPDGSMTISTLTEMTVDSGSGETYVEIPLTNLVTESALTTGKWYISLDSSGRAQAQYGLTAAPQTWTFGAQDVVDAETTYGIGAYTWVLPFDTGIIPIRVGDVIKGVTSGATGIVTAVEWQSGTWGSTAAGNLKIMTKTGTFHDNESITILGAIATVAVVAGGTTYAVGDILQPTQAGGAGAKIVVATLGGSAAVATVVVVDAGHGYSVASPLPTTYVTGSGGSACTLGISTLAATVYATTNTGAPADALKVLIGTEAFSAGNPITVTGQTVTYLPIFSVASAS